MKSRFLKFFVAIAATLFEITYAQHPVNRTVDSSSNNVTATPEQQLNAKRTLSVGMVSISIAKLSTAF